MVVVAETREDAARLTPDQRQQRWTNLQMIIRVTSAVLLVRVGNQCNILQYVKGATPLLYTGVWCSAVWWWQTAVWEGVPP